MYLIRSLSLSLSQRLNFIEQQNIKSSKAFIRSNECNGIVALYENKRERERESASERFLCSVE